MSDVGPYSGYLGSSDQSYCPGRTVSGPPSSVATLYLKQEISAQVGHHMDVLFLKLKQQKLLCLNDMQRTCPARVHACYKSILAREDRCR